MDKIYFSIAQANALIPRLEMAVRRLTYLKESLIAVSSLMIEYEDDNEQSLNLIKSNREFHRLLYELYTSLEQLHEAGAILQDLDLGLVDLYSIFDGKEIMLSWKLGEKMISFWHEPSEEHEARRSLSDLRAYPNLPN